MPASPRIKHLGRPGSPRSKHPPSPRVGGAALTRHPGQRHSAACVRHVCLVICLSIGLLISVLNAVALLTPPGGPDPDPISPDPDGAAAAASASASTTSFAAGLLSDHSEQLLLRGDQLPGGNASVALNASGDGLAGSEAQALAAGAGADGAAAALQAGAAATRGSIAGTSDIAMCLVGGARSFEATGPSILKHLIRRYEPVDVFLHAPLDEDAAKFWAMGDAERGARSIVHMRIFPNLEVDELSYPHDILQSAGSPNGVQGLLQYFRLVEGCLWLVFAHEKVRKFEYRWIVRARVDAYWQGPAPPPSVFNPRYYTIPFGNNFKGYNDRFGVGTRATAGVAMRRLALLSQIKKAGYTQCNSEKAYMAQFKVRRVKVNRVHFPFCVLGARLPAYIQGHCDPAVPSLASTTPLDGTKCLACAVCSNKAPKEARTNLYGYMDLRMERGRYPDARGIKICNLTGAWTPGQWQARFDTAAGHELAEQRVLIEKTVESRRSCIARWTTLQRRARYWDAPSPESICLRHWLGKVRRVGARAGAYETFLGVLSSSSVVVAPRVLGIIGEQGGVRRAHRSTDLGSGGDSSWDLVIQRDLGAKVLAWTLADLNNTRAALKKLGAARIDVLKLSTKGHDFPVVDILLRQFKELPVCQLLVSFPKATPSFLSFAFHKANKSPPKLMRTYAYRLKDAGMQLHSCLGGQGSAPERCHFYSITQCRAPED